MKRDTRFFICTLGAFLVVGCASTSTKISPEPQPPVCQHALNAQIFWSAQWREDQKDILAREAAAREGLTQFFANSGCFASTTLQYVQSLSFSTMDQAVAENNARYDRLVAITVRELGPIVKIGSSLAIVEGGTEVVLDVTEYQISGSLLTRSFSLHWQHGGPGVIKGVASLSQDMQSALVVALQPEKNK